MKHTFARKALLLGVVALAINQVPIVAMMPEQQLPTGIMQQIATEQKKYQNIPQEGLQKELKEKMDTLNKGYWKSMMRCITGDKATGEISGERCTKGQIALVIATLIGIIAIVRSIAAYTEKAPWTARERIIGGAIQSRMQPAVTRARTFASEQSEALRRRVPMPGISRAYVTEPEAYK